MATQVDAVPIDDFRVGLLDEIGGAGDLFSFGTLWNCGEIP